MELRTEICESPNSGTNIKCPTTGADIFTPDTYNKFYITCDFGSDIYYIDDIHVDINSQSDIRKLHHVIREATTGKFHQRSILYIDLQAKTLTCVGYASSRFLSDSVFVNDIQVRFDTL